jgi:hypothetical protein
MSADTIQTLTRRIRAAAREREQLRASSAGREALERNLRELAGLQRRLASVVTVRAAA